MHWQVDKKKQYLTVGFFFGTENILKIDFLQNREKGETKSTIKILKIIFTDFVIKKVFYCWFICTENISKSIFQSKEKQETKYN